MRDNKGVEFIVSMNGAILFDFTNSDSAWNAFTLLQELGYDPVLHTATRLHIQVINEDLTSALEIVQGNGGILAEEAKDNTKSIPDSFDISLEAIAIPAHIVNEDLIEQEELLPSIEGVNTFSMND